MAFILKRNREAIYKPSISKGSIPERVTDNLGRIVRALSFDIYISAATRLNDQPLYPSPPSSNDDGKALKSSGTTSPC